MGKKRKLSMLEGVLINQSGRIGHQLRRSPRVNAAPKTRKSRADKQAAR